MSSAYADSDKDADNKGSYRLSGVITSQSTGKPADEITVFALDANLDKKYEYQRQHLGRAVTGKHGEYEIVMDANASYRKDHRVLDVIVRLEDKLDKVILITNKPLQVMPGEDVRLDIASPGLEFGLDWQDIVRINGQPVNIKLAAQLSRRELVEVYLYLRGRTKELKRRKLVQKAFPDLFRRRDPNDDCGEGRLEVIRSLLEERGGSDIIDDIDADDLPAGATIHWFYTNKIRVKYTTDVSFPDDRVDPTLPAADQQLTLSDGTSIGWIRSNLSDLHSDNTEVAPVYVQKIGLVAEYALSRFISSTLTMRDPRNGSARLEYRIRQMDTGIFGQTSATWSHVEVGPNNNDLQNMHTVPHEMFHQVQYRYNDTTVRSGIYSSLREGGARLIEDSINDLPNRYVDTASLIFNDPTQSLADSPSVSVVGTSSYVRYASGIFWKYLAEHHSVHTTSAEEPAIGVDAYQRVLEGTATVLSGDPGVGYDPTALRTARTNMPWYGRFDQFRYYDISNTELDSHETSWGNYLIANYMHGTANPVADTRFEYNEDEDSVTWPGAAVAKLAALQASVSSASDDISLTRGGSGVTRSVTGQREWAAHYYRISPSGSPGPRLLRVTFTSSGGMTDPLIQILRLGPSSALIDIHRSDQPSYSKTIDMQDLSSVVVIVASRANPGDFLIQFDEVASASDTMITRWNSKVGTEYEVDPKGWAWAWISPDVMVDNDDDVMADTQVFFGQNNKLKVRVRNRGNQNASDVQIDFWYQKATPYLSTTGWIPVQDVAMITQQITGETVIAGTDKWLTVNWAPVDDGTHHEHWCVKVKVTVAGEPNTDNKIALSNFSHVVIPGDGDDVRILVRLPDRYRSAELSVIPHGQHWMFEAPILPQGSSRNTQGNKECYCHGTFNVETPSHAIITSLKVMKQLGWTYSIDQTFARTVLSCGQKYTPTRSGSF